MRGRPPKPTKLKILQGTARKDRENPKEPQPDATFPDPPDWFKEDERYFWEQHRAALADTGIITQADQQVLVNICVDQAIQKQAIAMVHEHGLLYKTTSGNIIQNPALGVANKANERILKNAVQIGITPSSRTRVQVDKQPVQPENRWAKF